MVVEIAIHALPAKPDRSTNVILISKNGYSVSVPYSLKHDKFNAYDNIPADHAFNDDEFVGWAYEEDFVEAIEEVMQ